MREFNRNKDQRGITLLQITGTLAGILVIVAMVWHIADHFRNSAVRFSTPYQAVLLTNGSVYFGQLNDYGTSHPVLTDVFYVQSSVNPDTKQATNVLIKRGKELHAPDRMYINANQIVFVESVGINSKVAQLIAEQKKQ